MYGPLNNYSGTSVLPEPPVSVKSFRVLSDTSDQDLFEAIDAIEDIVPRHQDIKVYNLSIGPSGPIVDDSINRFTFACDRLSKRFGVLFCVAVGNDGEVAGYERIQSPSDMVNGLAVGAYTKDNGRIVKAPYSCTGPGREGNKVKPDILAFGGCAQHPIHLIGGAAGRKTLNLGTSFASPIVARTAGQLIGHTNPQISSLVARALIVHSSSQKGKKGIRHEFGHGAILDDIEDIVSCEGNSYTLIYETEIEAGKYATFSIPWSNDIETGTANFHWTGAVLTDVDPYSPDDYTFSSIEVTFYPNDEQYKFTKDGKSRTVNILEQSELVKILESDGWVRGKFPITKSPGSNYKTEAELRGENLKWDTIDVRTLSKRSNSIKNPYFIVHALGRGGRRSSERVKFSIALTVSLPKNASVDLYSRVLNIYPALVPLEVNLEAQVSVRS